MTVPDMDFAYKITLANAMVILVARPSKRHGEYLKFHIGMIVSPEHRAAMAQLTIQQATIVIHELQLEMARLGISFNLAFAQSTNQTPTPNQLEAINLGKGILIVSLSESVFMSHLESMDSAGIVGRSVLALVLQRYSPDSTKLALP